MLEINLNGIKVSEDVSFDVLAEKLDGYSGSDITNVHLCILTNLSTIHTNRSVEMQA